MDRDPGHKRTVVLIKYSVPVVERGLPPNRWRLSGEGRRRSVALAGWLGRYRPGAVVSSEEPKAVGTAEILAGKMDVACSTSPGLHEHDRTGAPFLDTVEEFERAARRLFENPDDLVWGNETATQALTRFEGALRTVLQEHEEDVLAVVTHGTMNALFVAKYNDVEAYDLWRGLGLPSFCILSAPAFRLEGTVLDLEPRTYSPRREL